MKLVRKISFEVHVFFLLLDYWYNHHPLIKIIQSTLNEFYNWETAVDTESTWRIGDGTAPFYNYIYHTVAGFTESDAFRSNQIRDGLLSREEALKIVNNENNPRYESIKWYLNIIGLGDKFNEIIKRLTLFQKYGKIITKPSRNNIFYFHQISSKTI